MVFGGGVFHQSDVGRSWQRIMVELFILVWLLLSISNMLFIAVLLCRAELAVNAISFTAI